MSESDLLDAGYLERKQLDALLSFTRTVHDVPDSHEPRHAGTWVAEATCGWHGLRLEWQPDAQWGLPRCWPSVQMLRFGKVLLEWH